MAQLGCTWKITSGDKKATKYANRINLKKVGTEKDAFVKYLKEKQSSTEIDKTYTKKFVTPYSAKLWDDTGLFLLYPNIFKFYEKNYGFFASQTGIQVETKNFFLAQLIEIITDLLELLNKKPNRISFVPDKDPFDPQLQLNYIRIDYGGFIALQTASNKFSLFFYEGYSKNNKGEKVYASYAYEWIMECT